jgi:hypothetical protein
LDKDFALRHQIRSDSRLSDLRCLLLTCCPKPCPIEMLPERQRLAHIVAEQMHVCRERERRRVVAEPPLYLDGVPTAVKQQRGAGVSERVEPSPRRSYFLSDGPQYPRQHVRVIERAPRSGREHQNVGV